MSLLEMSASGAIMILVIVILRALAINRLPKRTFLTLWGLALLRLLLPFQIPSPLSVYSFASCFSKGNILPEQVSKNNLTFTIPSESSAALAAPFLPEQATFFVLPWTIVWLMGMLVCASFFTISYCKCYREFQTSLPFHDARTKKWLCEHKRLRTIEIRQSDRIWTPLTYGIVHPVILLPKNMEQIEKTSLEYILAHEYVHIKRFDTVTKLIASAALCVHWFNPIVWLMYMFVNRDMELSCDETVVRLFSENTRSDYARTIIRMAEHKGSLTPLCSNFSKNATQERIVAIMKTKKVTVWTTILAVCLISGFSIVFLTTAKTASPVGGSAPELPIAWEDNTAENKSLAYQFSKCKNFPEYEKFGLSYDSHTEYLIYNGQTIGYFKDEFSPDKYTRFVDETGEIGICVKRSENWEMTGLEEFPISEVYFGEDIAPENAPTMVSAVEATYTAASEDGDNCTPNQEYLDAGLDWDWNVHAWFYNGKLVADLYDHNGGIYTCDIKSKSGVTYIEVIRSKTNSIQELHEITKEKMQKLISN